MKVLVIEDNEILSRNIVRYLSARDIHVQICLDGKEWYHQASLNYYDAIILDINLPNMNGNEICKKLREKWKNTPIIMLTSNSTNQDVIEWLWLWADDYLTKPFEYSILLARIDAITRRILKNKSNTKIHVNDEIILDLEKYELFKKWEKVHLSTREFDLIKFLAQNKSKAMSREEIYQSVWGEADNDFIFSKTIDVYIWYLRKKLGKEIIQTRKWYWYIIE